MIASQAFVKRFVALTKAHRNEVVTAYVIAVDDHGVLYDAADYVSYREGSDPGATRIIFSVKTRHFVPWCSIESIRIYPRPPYMNSVIGGVELVGEGLAIFDG